jgi:hypothetical protein
MKLLSKHSLGNNPACKEALERLGKAVLINDPAVLPRIRREFMEVVPVLKEARLIYQLSLNRWKAVIAFAEDMGLQVVDARGGANILAGKGKVKLIFSASGFPLQGSTYHLDDDDRRQASDHLGRQSLYFPEVKVNGHRLRYGPPKELRIHIPASIVMRINEAKDIRLLLSERDTMPHYSLRDGKVHESSYSKQELFDEFAILAPTHCWTNPLPRDPALFGVIHGPWNRATKEWDHRYAFLGRWE